MMQPHLHEEETTNNDNNNDNLQSLLPPEHKVIAVNEKYAVGLHCVLVFEPVWTYSFGGTASKSNIALIEGFQSKALCAITNTLWFVSNKNIYSSLHLSTLSETITMFSERYLKRQEEQQIL